MFCSCGQTARVIRRPQGGGEPAIYCSLKCRDRAARKRTFAWRKTPRGQFIAQRDNAKRRGIEWQFTFEQWIEWWGNDLSKRGRKADDLCMARFGDKGPYAPGNCFKQTMKENLVQREHFAGCAAAA
jgi:hypothetical protein